jgi:hypothetical protein
MVKRTIAFFLAALIGLFLTITPRSVWGEEFRMEEEEEVEVECDEQCEETGEKLGVLQEEVTYLSFMLWATKKLPRAWHHEMPQSKRTPVRLGNHIVNPHRLSPKQAAEAIMAVVENAPEPPPLNEMTDQEVRSWRKIDQACSRAQFVLHGRYLGPASLPVTFIKPKHRHRAKR